MFWIDISKRLEEVKEDVDWLLGIIIAGQERERTYDLYRDLTKFKEYIENTMRILEMQFGFKPIKKVGIPAPELEVEKLRVELPEYKIKKKKKEEVKKVPPWIFYEEW